MSTSHQWSQPTPDRVAQIINYALPKTDALGLDLYIMGRCLIDMSSTVDLDMFVFGDVDNQKLEDLLHDLLDYSLNQQKILLDIAWSGVVVPFEECNGALCFKPNTLKILNPWHWNSGDQSIIKNALTVRKGAQLTDFMAEVYFDNNDKLSKKHIDSLKINKNYFGILAREYNNGQGI